MKVLAIIGAGVLGQQIAHYVITDGHYSKVVFIDDFTLENKINGFDIIGKVKDVEKLYQSKFFDEIIIGIGYNHLDKRKEIFELLKDKIPFGKFVHSTCWVDDTVEIMRGCVLYPNSTFDYKAKIHENTVITNDCTIAHDSIIGAHSFYAARAMVAGFVEIGELCFIGLNSIIIENVTIASKTQLGAGSVVIKSIEKNGLYVGHPVRFIR
jgi:sugar O-acyltransferase (sialic acid O-acetyltransferase NeuD family)